MSTQTKNAKSGSTKEYFAQRAKRMDSAEADVQAASIESGEQSISSAPAETSERISSEGGGEIMSASAAAPIRGGDVIKSSIDAPVPTGDVDEQTMRETIDLILRYGNGGRLFGTTFIDHNSRAVINGSTLGKDFAANALAERFPDLATESRENKRVVPPTPMAGEDVSRSTQRTSSDELYRAADPAERAHNVLVHARTSTPTPTSEASHQTVWLTQSDREAIIQQKSDNAEQGPDNTDHNPDNHLTIPDLSSVGDAAGSLLSILTPAPGGQTTYNRHVRRPQPLKKKKGRSV